MPLGLFALLWIAGRIAMLWSPAWAAALVDLPFLPLVALVLYRLMQRARHRRNLALVGILVLISLANLAYHLAALGQIAVGADRAVQAALLLIVLLLTVMGGRVLPGFTANAAMVRTVSRPRLDQCGIALVAATFLAWLCLAPAIFLALLSTLAGVVHLVRLHGWRPQRTLAHPLLWILHLAYAWISIGLFLLAASALGWCAASNAFHAFAVGAMSSMIIGMIARTTRGHTGQAIAAGKPDMAMFACMQLGAVGRVCANFHWGHWREALLVLSAVLWSTSFLLYLLTYAPALFRPRQDGREG
jgi:uncharacterized protein involved in response to NO